MYNIEKITKLDNYILNKCESNIIPAINVFIKYDNRKWMTSHGNKQIVPRIFPNSLDTFFDIGNLTMPLITLILFLKLNEDEIINIDDQVSKYIKSLKSSVTIKDCLLHTTGFNDLEGNISSNNVISNINKMIPSTKYEISPTNYILLGILIDKLDDDYNEYIKEKYFNPLKMRSTFIIDLIQSSNCASTLDENKKTLNGIATNKLARDHSLYGYSGGFMNINDISDIIGVILNDGKHGNLQFLNTESISFIKEALIKLSNINLGRKKKDRFVFLSDTGCLVYIDFKTKLSYSVLTNSLHQEIDNNDLIDIFSDINKLILESIE